MRYSYFLITLYKDWTLITAALITAAGKNDDLKTPETFLNIGSRTFLEHTLANLKKAGVQLVVVITGYQHRRLERYYADEDIIFLQNEDYNTTDMYASVCLGLEYLKSRCDRVLISPSDVPFLSAEPLLKLLQNKSAAAVPVYKEKSGHPIMLDASLIPALLETRTDGGLIQAVIECWGVPARVQVDVPTVTVDINTDEDYKDLLSRNNDPDELQDLHTRTDLNILKNRTSFSPEAARFLQIVQRCGSMQTASRIMNTYYTKCWKMIKEAESALGIKFLENKPGGADGGSSELTAEGQRFRHAYNSTLKLINSETEAAFRRNFSEWL